MKRWSVECGTRKEMSRYMGARGSHVLISFPAIPRLSSPQIAISTCWAPKAI